eukprot:6190114-Pleurochrysis_carterae.AAC.1
MLAHMDQCPCPPEVAPSRVRATSGEEDPAARRLSLLKAVKPIVSSAMARISMQAGTILYPASFASSVIRVPSLLSIKLLALDTSMHLFVLLFLVGMMDAHETGWGDGNMRMMLMIGSMLVASSCRRQGGHTAWRLSDLRGRRRGSKRTTRTEGFAPPMRVTVPARSA